MRLSWGLVLAVLAALCIGNHSEMYKSASQFQLSCYIVTSTLTGLVAYS
jgi:hypothetical protein